jgi:hypothetical protein
LHKQHGKKFKKQQRAFRMEEYKKNGFGVKGKDPKSTAKKTKK